MKRKNLIVTGICVLILTVGLLGRVFASPTQEDLDRARMEQLQREIVGNQEEYVSLQPQKERNQQRCTLAGSQEKQMTILNTMNNAKRSELNFLQAKYSPLMQPRK